MSPKIKDTNSTIAPIRPTTPPAASYMRIIITPSQLLSRSSGRYGTLLLATDKAQTNIT